MKKPEIPPAMEILWDRLNPSMARYAILVSVGRTWGREHRDYLHWNQMRRRTPPEGFSHEEWWLATKSWRLGAYRPIPLLDTSGNRFQFYSLTDWIQESLPERVNVFETPASGN